MPRNDPEEEAIEKEVKAKKNIPKQTPAEAPQQQGIVEVPINLELINNKLNYLISAVDIILQAIPKKKTR